MSKVTTKTNNDLGALEHKIQLRLNSLPDKPEIKVLECFGGEGVLWREVQKRTTKKIRVLGIDKVKYKRFQLQADSLKVLKGMDLTNFDIVDLDSYGVPYEHCQIVFEKGYKGIVHCTVIQTMMGNLPHGLLSSLGYTKKMVNKCQTLFSRNGFDKFKAYLAINGVSDIEVYSLGRKNYLWFNLYN